MTQTTEPRWRRWLKPVLDNLSSTEPALPVPTPTASTTLAEQLARARVALEAGRPEDVVDDLKATNERLQVLGAATWSILGTAYNQLDMVGDRNAAYKKAVRMFNDANISLQPIEILAIVPALVAQGKQAKAIQTLRAVADEQPQDIEVARALAEQLVEAGDQADAAAAYLEVAHRLPADCEKEALEYLRLAVKHDPANPEYQAAMGRALVRTGDGPGGVVLLREAVSQLPESHEARAWLAEGLAVSGAPAEALSLADAILQNGPSDPTLEYVRGRALAKLGQPEEAVSAFRLALSAPVVTPELTSSINVELGEALRAEQRYDEAAVAFDTALSLRPDNVRGLLGRGGVHFVFEEYDAAAEVFSSAVDKANRNGDAAAETEALSNLGETFRLQERFPEALDALDRAIAIQAPSAFVLGTKGQVLASLGRRQEGIVALTAAIDIDPSLGWARASLAELYRLEGRSQEALDELDRAAALIKETSFTRGTRGQILAALDRPTEAIDELRAAWTLDNAAWIAEDLTRLLADRSAPGDASEAIAVIDQALKVPSAPRDMLERKADLLRMSGQPVDALATIDRYLSDRSVSQTDTALATKAHILIDLGRFSEGLDLSEQIIARSAQYTFAWYAKIRAVLGLNDYDLALTELDSLLGVVPGDPYALAMKASLYCDLRRFEPALEILRGRSNDDTPEPLTEALIGYCLRRHHPIDLEAAANYLRSAIEIDPKELWYKVELADTLDESLSNNAEEAERLRREVVAAVPLDRPANANDAALAGWATLFLGDATEAAARLRVAIQLGPGEIGPRFSLAFSLLLAGGEEAALAEDEFEGTINLARRQPSTERSNAYIREALDDLHRIQRLQRVRETKSSERVETMLESALDSKRLLRS